MAFAKQPPGDGNRESAGWHRSPSSRFEWLRPGLVETKVKALAAHNVGFLPGAKALALCRPLPYPLSIYGMVSVERTILPVS